MGNPALFGNGQALDPVASADDAVANEGFDQINALADGVQREDGKSRKPAQAEGNRNRNYPHETAVIEEGGDSFAAGTDGVVNADQVSHNGFDCRQNQDQTGGKRSHLGRCVVKQGEEGGDHRQ